MATLVKDYVFATGSAPTGYGSYHIFVDKWESQDNEKTAGWLYKPQYRILGIVGLTTATEPQVWLVIDETEDREFIDTARCEIEAHQKSANYCFHHQFKTDR